MYCLITIINASTYGFYISSSYSIINYFDYPLHTAVDMF